MKNIKTIFASAFAVVFCSVVFLFFIAENDKRQEIQRIQAVEFSEKDKLQMIRERALEVTEQKAQDARDKEYKKICQILIIYG